MSNIMSGLDNSFVVPSLPSQNLDVSKNEGPCCSEENKTQTKIVFDYNPPEWCKKIPSDSVYNLDIIKNGVIVETIKLNESKNISYFTIGRIPENDIIMLHPSISRLHAIIQYGNGDDGIGYYIMDNNSAHKTKLNKKILDSKNFVKLRNGFSIQLGGSTRFIVFNGPDEEQERENERHNAEYNRLKELLKFKKNAKTLNSLPSSHLDYESYNSRDNYEVAVEDTSTETKTDQAEEFWNEMAKRRKQKKDEDNDEECFWDETKSIDDIRKRKAEEKAFLESFKVKHKKVKQLSISQKEIEKRVDELKKAIVEEKEKIDIILKEHKMEENNSSINVLLSGKVKIPKKQGLTVPLSSSKKMQLAHSMNTLQSLETELENLQKSRIITDDEDESSPSDVLLAEDS